MFDSITSTGMVAAAVLSIAGASRLVYGFFTKAVKHAIRDVHGDLEAWDEFLTHQFASVSDRIAKVEGAVSSIESQLKPNGGSSARDVLDRIERILREKNGD